MPRPAAARRLTLPPNASPPFGSVPLRVASPPRHPSVLSLTRNPLVSLPYCVFSSYLCPRSTLTARSMCHAPPEPDVLCSLPSATRLRVGESGVQCASGRDVHGARVCGGHHGAPLPSSRSAVFYSYLYLHCSSLRPYPHLHTRRITPTSPYSPRTRPRPISLLLTSAAPSGPGLFARSVRASAVSSCVFRSTLGSLLSLFVSLSLGSWS